MPAYRPSLGEDEAVVHVVHAELHDRPTEVVEIGVEVHHQRVSVHERADGLAAKEFARVRLGETLDERLPIDDSPRQAVGDDRTRHHLGIVGMKSCNTSATGWPVQRTGPSAAARRPSPAQSSMSDPGMAFTVFVPWEDAGTRSGIEIRWRVD